jgi:hypothetical protein
MACSLMSFECIACTVAYVIGSGCAITALYVWTLAVLTAKRQDGLLFHDIILLHRPNELYLCRSDPYVLSDPGVFWLV